MELLPVMLALCVAVPLADCSRARGAERTARRVMRGKRNRDSSSWRYPQASQRHGSVLSCYVSEL